MFLADKKKRSFVSPPVIMRNVVKEESLQLKFTAQLPGAYNYTVIVKSDSYLDCDTMTNLKVFFKPLFGHFVF